MILAQTLHEIYSSGAVRCCNFARFLNFDNYQPEVVSDVISGAVVDPMGLKFRAKFGDSQSNRYRDTRLPHFVANDTDAGRRTPIGRRFA